MDYNEALEQLRLGNQEYRDTHSNSSRLTEADRKYHVENGQHPYACIICCSDSRVVPEHIFSVGLGALFTVRTAGNVIGEHEIGSAEYAALHLHTPLIVVMGHTHCGAVSAAVEGHAEGKIQVITDAIRRVLTNPSDLRACEWENARYGARKLAETPYLSRLVKNGTLKILPAMYDTESGEVVFADK